MGDGGTERTGSRPTLDAIARRASVSLATVSKVLNGRPGVAPSTRDRVEVLLAASGYARRGGPPAPGSLVELVVEDLSSEWSIEIVRGVERVAREHGYALALSALGPHHAVGEDWVAGVLHRRPAAVVLQFSALTAGRRDQLRARGIPFTVVDPVGDPPDDVPVVGATNTAGGAAATQHLLDLGHRRIAAIAGPLDMQCALDRLAGHRAALAAVGLETRATPGEAVGLEARATPGAAVGLEARAAPGTAAPVGTPAPAPRAVPAHDARDAVAPTPASPDSASPDSALLDSALPESASSDSALPVAVARFSRADGERAARHLLAVHPRPTAVVTGNDLQALGVLDAARSLGLRVPEDLSVVGFDDVAPARWARPALTTVRQPLQEMAELATRTALRQHDGGPVDVARLELATSLVVRDSTAAPPRAP